MKIKDISNCNTQQLKKMAVVLKKIYGSYYFQVCLLFFLFNICFQTIICGISEARLQLNGVKLIKYEFNIDVHDEQWGASCGWGAILTTQSTITDSKQTVTITAQPSQIFKRQCNSGFRENTKTYYDASCNIASANSNSSGSNELQCWDSIVDIQNTYFNLWFTFGSGKFIYYPPSPRTCCLDLQFTSHIFLNSNSTTTLQIVCSEPSTAKALRIKTGSNTLIISETPPTGTEFLINGIAPSVHWGNLSKPYDNAYEWEGSLEWNVPINATCGEQITITPSISNGYVGSNIDSIEAIFEEGNLALTLNPSEIYPNKAGSPVSSVVIAKLVDNEGDPLSGYQINFQLEIIESKGHAHTNTRNPGVIDGWCVTDENGQCSVNYYSSLVAGKDRITAYLSDYPDVKDSKEIIVKVPGLVPLYEYVFYYLTGNARPGPGDRHPDNHYGTAGTNDKVATIAWEYFTATDALLGINDMSLEWGGLFDICGTWNSSDVCSNAPNGGHTSHRKGTGVDIDRCAKSVIQNNPNPQGNCNIGRIKVDKVNIKQLCRDKGGRLVEEATIHCELP